MKTRAAELFGRLKAAWSRSSPVQRWLALGLAAALVVAAGIGYFLNRPQWVVLVSQVEPEDAAAIVACLDEMEVPYRPAGDGYTIMVPESEYYTAKLALAQAGLPNSGTVGMELFDTVTFGATEFDKRVNLLRAQQGELERALMRIAEVDYANVKLAIPEQSVFVRDQKPVEAAVLLETKAGKQLSKQQIEGIIQFIASSVEGLEPENVRVVDQSGRLLSTGLESGDTLSVEVDADQLQRERALQQEMEDRVQTLLEPIFGAGNVVSKVHLELNLDTSRIESQRVEGATPTHTATTQETTTALPGEAGAVAGDAAAVPVYQSADQANNGGTQTWRQSTETDYGLSQSTQVTVIPPGSIKRISVGIAINQPALTPEQIAGIQQTVAGATGAETDAISVIAMAFTEEKPSGAVEAPVAQAPSAVQPVPLAVGAALALLVLLFGVVVTRRRQAAAELAMADAMAEQTAGMTTGEALDVALGLEKEAQAAGEPVQPSEEPAESPARTDGQSAREHLQVIMASKPKRQLIIDGEPVDEALLQAAEELIQDSPEAAAEVVRRWIKGGP